MAWNRIGSGPQKIENKHFQRNDLVKWCMMRVSCRIKEGTVWRNDPAYHWMTATLTAHTVWLQASPQTGEFYVILLAEHFHFHPTFLFIAFMWYSTFAHVLSSVRFKIQQKTSSVGLESLSLHSGIKTFSRSSNTPLKTSGNCFRVNRAEPPLMTYWLSDC